MLFSFSLSCFLCLIAFPFSLLTAKPLPTCTDSKQNGAETDVDCGGPTCAPCTVLYSTCEEDADCKSERCGFPSDATPGDIKNNRKRCLPSCKDGIHNLDETDVDCGGTDCGPLGGCAVDKGCLGDENCAFGLECVDLEEGQVLTFAPVPTIKGKYSNHLEPTPPQVPSPTAPYGDSKDAKTKPAPVITKTCQNQICFPDDAKFSVKVSEGVYQPTNAAALKIGDVVQCVKESGILGECDVIFHFHTTIPYNPYLDYPYRKIVTSSGATLYISENHMMWASNDVSLAGTTASSISTSDVHYLRAVDVNVGHVVALLNADGTFKFEEVISTGYTGKDGVNAPLITEYGTPIVDGFVASSFVGSASMITYKQSSKFYWFAYEWQKNLASHPAIGQTAVDPLWLTYFRSHVMEYAQIYILPYYHLLAGEVLDDLGFVTEMKQKIASGTNFAGKLSDVKAIWETYWS